MTTTPRDCRPLIRVVDDNDDTRDSLVFMLRCEGWETAAYSSAEAFLAGDVPSRTGCLVLDIRMAGMSGLELQQELVRRRSRLPVIFLTGHADIPTAVNAMREGAFTFLQKPVDPLKLLPAVARAAEADARKRGAEHLPAERLNLLTERETEIIRLAADGMVSRQIAEQLGLSRRTVEHYRASALKKLGVSTAAEAALILANAERL